MLVLVPLLANSLSHAQTLTWTGAANGTSFGLAGNWSPAAIPGPSNDCVIPAGPGGILLTIPVTLKSLSIGRSLTLGACASLTLTGDLTFSSDAPLFVDDNLGCSMIKFGSGSHSIKGHGEIRLRNNGTTGRAILAEGGASLTIHSTVTVRLDADSSTAQATLYADVGSTIINQGRIASLQIGKTLIISGPGAFTNEGIVEAAGGKVITQAGTWSNSGTLAVSGTGEFNAAGTYSALGSVSRSGGTLRLSGNFSGASLEATAATGPILLSNFTATGTTLLAQDPAVAPIVVDGYTFLNNCTIGVDISMQNCAILSVTSGLAFSNNATLTIDPGNSCSFYPLIFNGGTQSVSGAGAIAFKRALNSGDARACNLRNNVSLTIEPGVSLVSSAATPATFSRIDVDAGSTLINKGLIAANVAGLSLYISGAGTLQNLGTLEATHGRLVIDIASWSSGGTLHLLEPGAIVLGGSFPALGTVVRSGGTLTISGAYGGASLEASDATGDLRLLGSISNLALKSSGTARLVVSPSESGLSNATLNACTLEGAIDVVGQVALEITNGLTLINGAVVNLRATTYNRVTQILFTGSNQSLSGTGEILYADRAGTAQIGVAGDCHLTIGSNISVRDLSSASGAQTVKVALEQTASLTNLGSFEASQPDRTLQFTGGTFINEGTLFATAGTLDIAAAWSNNGFISLADGATLSLGGLYADFGYIDRAGGAVVLKGTFTGTSLSTADVAGDITFGDVSITGATLETADNARILVKGNPILDACVLAGTLVNGDCSHTTVRNGLMLDNATILFAPTGPCSPLSSYVFFGDGPQSLAGTGTVLLDRGQLYVSNAVTFGPGISISIGAPGVGSNGSILVSSNSSLISHSTITANAPTARITINGNGTFTNLGSLRVLSGTIDARNLLGSTGNIELNPAARLILGGNYTIDSDLSITSGGQLEFYGNWTNNATITADHGRVIFGGTWTNTGAFHISNSTWNIGGVYPSLGNYTSTSNTLTLSGTFPGTSIAADASTGDISLSNVTFNNATFSASGGAKFLFGGGIKLNGCTFATDISLAPCAGTVITGGLTLNNATVTVDLNCKNDALAFSGPDQTLGGTGAVRIKSDSNGNSINAINAPGTSLTIAPGITLSLDSDATDATASLAIQTGSLINQGVIEVLRPGGTLSISGAGNFINQGHLSVATGKLDIAKLSGPLGSLALAPGASLSLAGNYSLADPLTISDGATLTLIGTWTTSTALSANNANLILGGTWTNTGAFAVTNSNWTIGGTYPSLGTHTFSNTALTYAGTFPGTSLVANAATGNITLGVLTLSNATLSAADGATFTFTNNALVTLNKCTIATDLVVGSCASLSITNGITLANNAALRVRTPGCSAHAIRVSGGTQLIGGSGSILYDKSKTLALLYFDPGTSATIGAGIFLGFDPASTDLSSAIIVASTNLINQGTIASRTAGRVLTISTGTFNNLGTVESTAGTLQVSPSNLTNYNTTTKTLTGGTWRAVNGSLLLTGRSVNAIGPNTELVLQGQSITTPVLTGLASSAGTLRLADRTLSVPAFSNSGMLDLGVGAILNVAGTFTPQPASTLRVEIAGLSPNQFGRVVATDVATLAGKLQGSFSAPYAPVASDLVSPFISAPTIAGGFSSVCFDSNPFLLGVAPIAGAGSLDLLVTPSSGLLPTILQDPSDSSSPHNAILSVFAGPSDAVYQWRKGETLLEDGPTGFGSSISGAHTPQLTIHSVTASDVGSYDVLVSNSCAAIASSPAFVRLCSGDLNNDGLVDDSDFTLFVSAYNVLDCAEPGMSAGCPGDLTGDGFVDDADFIEFVAAYNELLCP
jgi:hypothetical protein